VEITQNYKQNYNQEQHKNSNNHPRKHMQKLNQMKLKPGLRGLLRQPTRKRIDLFHSSRARTEP